MFGLILKLLFILKIVQASTSHVDLSNFPTYNGPSTRIINGEAAKRNQFPYQAALYIESAYKELFCGGTLITDRYVLTAAHCLDRAVKVTVVLGALSLTDPTEPKKVLTIDHFVLHEDFDPVARTNDLALIKLSTRVEKSANIAPISWASGSATFSGRQGTASGWGVTAYSQQTNVDVLRFVKTQIISNERCKSIDPFGSVIVDSHLCTSGETNVATCLGDSGGPLVVDNVLVGVIAFGYKYCDPAKPSAYMRVSKFDRWIRNNLV